ncbi:MAG TPA: hypothetical protein VNA24_11725 [Hyalangium sp.]|nr:hypothetical protein [Hyalangium sp.]
MNTQQSSSLRMPSFLHGTYAAVHQQARAEGFRCGEQYRREGSFSLPLPLLEVPSGEIVMTHEVADFHRERPAWRLHMVSVLMDGLYEALGWRDPLPVRDAYEAFFRETPWGALYFAISPTAPKSAQRTALRHQAVLAHWESLLSARYLFKKLHPVLNLEELMSAACDWAMDAWSPEGDSPVRERLERAAERMARATQEDCIEAILRQLPLVLPFARDLKHPETLADPQAQRQHLLAMDPKSFARVSGACTPALIECLYDWDHDLEMQ